MSNEYIFFTDQTALTFRICLVHGAFIQNKMNFPNFFIEKYFCLYLVYWCPRGINPLPQYYN